MVQGNPVFSLLDEQFVVFNLVKSKVRQLELASSKAVVMVLGGPGTGKSVIGVQLLAELAKQGRNVVHCTGSKAFTTNMRAQVGSKASAVFKYFNSFVDQEPDSIDVIVADEAHRIRESSNTRFQRKSARPQIFEMLDSAKMCVFLLDDNQVVRPGEVGTPALIRESARNMGAEFFEMELKGQFRCSGSESYLSWLDYAMGIDGDLDTGWREDYEFEICDSPEEMEAKLAAKQRDGDTARMVAGFCWPWSDPDTDGMLLNDIVVGDWERPWNRKAKGSSPPPHKDPYTIWVVQEERRDLRQRSCMGRGRQALGGGRDEGDVLLG